MVTNLTSEAGALPLASWIISRADSVSTLQAIMVVLTVYLILNRIGYYKRTVCLPWPQKQLFAQLVD
jgi:hypothetical protein